MNAVHTIDEWFGRFLEHHDENDLGEVFDLAAPELTAMARRGRLDAAGCEDALQETFLTILRRSHTFRSGRRFMPWAQGIMARQIKVERRRQARRLRALGLDASDVNEDLARGPRQVLEDSELRQQIEEAIAGLSSTHREVVDRALLKGESASDLAQGMGLSTNAVAVRLHRGLNQIRRVLPKAAALGIAGAMATRARGASSVRSTITEAARVHGLRAAGAQAWWLSPAALVTAAGLTVVATGAWLFQHDDGQLGLEAVNAREVVSTPPSPEAADLASVAGQEPNRRSASGGEPEAATAETGDGGVDLTARAILQVLSPDGRPVGAGAEVFVLQTNPRVILPQEPMTAFATTDEAGRFLAPTTEEAGDATPLFYVRSTEATPPLAGVLQLGGASPGEGVTPLHLSEALKLEFEVKDEHGQPIEGAQVAALGLVDELFSEEAQRALDHGMLWPIGYRHLFGAETDASGRCVIDCFLTQEFNGQLVGNAAAWHPGRSSYAEPFEVAKGASGQLSFTLPTIESLDLAGRVVDEAGTPLEGAEVHFSFRGFEDLDDSLTSVTQSDGSWSLDAEDLDWFPIELRFEYEGHVTRTQAFGNPNDLPPTPIEIVMTPATSLRGRVIGVDGRPAAAELTLVSMGHQAVGKSGSDGEFLLEKLSVESGVLYAVGAHGARGTATMDVQSFASPIEVVLSAAPVAPDVTVHAVHPRSGNPLPIIELALLRQGDETGAWPRVKVQDGEGLGIDVPPGKWSAVAMLDDDLGAVSLDFEVPATEEPLRVEIPYTEGGQLGVVIHAAPELDTSTGRALISRVLGPEIPVWARASNELARNELGLSIYPDITQGTIWTMPGTTDIVVEGDGWATRPVRFQAMPDETIRLDLEAIPAGTVHLRCSPMQTPGCLTLEVQPVNAESRTSDWSRVASALTAADQPIDYTLQLPPGDWRWRATASAFLDEVNVHRAGSQTTGTMTVITGETIVLQVLGQQGSAETSGR